MAKNIIIVGGGPAGLNAALVLGRAHRAVHLFDDSLPRNRVTLESHGFITRDGVTPSEFRRIAHEELRKYPSIVLHLTNKVQRITQLPAQGKRTEFEVEVVERDDDVNNTKQVFNAQKVIIATGLREIFPNITGLEALYGKSIHNCMYCDGWESSNKPLFVLGETPMLFHLAKGLFQWSKDLIVCTNGNKGVLDDAQRSKLLSRGLSVNDNKVVELIGEEGKLKEVVFEDGTRIERKGGFVMPTFIQSTTFAQQLGCEIKKGPLCDVVVADTFGRTNVKGIYVAGDTAMDAGSQLIFSAAAGSKCATAVNADLTEEDWE